MDGLLHSSRRKDQTSRAYCTVLHHTAYSGDLPGRRESPRRESLKRNGKCMYRLYGGAIYTHAIPDTVLVGPRHCLGVQNGSLVNTGWPSIQISPKFWLASLEICSESGQWPAVILSLAVQGELESLQLWKEQSWSGALHITDNVGANGLSSSLKKGPFNFCSFFLCTRDLDEWVAELRSREERLKAREAALQEWEMALDVREKQLKGLLCTCSATCTVEIASHPACPRTQKTTRKGWVRGYSREPESHFRLH